MKMKSSKTIFVCLLAFAGARAFADSDSNGTGLFLEPGVSYQVTSSKVDVPSGNTSSNTGASTNGFGILLRGGVHVWDRFFVAADGRYALLRFDDNARNVDVRATSWDIAPVVGWQMPENGPRLYLGYVVAGNVDPQESSGNNFEFDQATGWRVGAGLQVRHVSVNIEWQRLHYNSGKYATASATSNGVSYNPEGLVASVTFPIEFP